MDVRFVLGGKKINDRWVVKDRKAGIVTSSFRTRDEARAFASKANRPARTVATVKTPPARGLRKKPNSRRMPPLPVSAEIRIERLCDGLASDLQKIVSGAIEDMATQLQAVLAAA